MRKNEKRNQTRSSPFQKRLGTRALNILRKMATDGIPVVDFSALSVENKDPFSEISKGIQDLVDQVYQAFSTIGFVYLKNHGIPQEMVSFPLTFSLRRLTRALTFLVSKLKFVHRSLSMICHDKSWKVC